MSKQAATTRAGKTTSKSPHRPVVLLSVANHEAVTMLANIRKVPVWTLADEAVSQWLERQTTERERQVLEILDHRFGADPPPAPLMPSKPHTPEQQAGVARELARIEERAKSGLKRGQRLIMPGKKPDEPTADELGVEPGKNVASNPFKGT